LDAKITPQGVTIASDFTGSVAVVTNESGTVVERDAYDAWGKRRDALTGADDAACNLPGLSVTTRGFTGHEQIAAACLVNANARIYDPAIGRFLAPDSIVPDPEDSQSYNRYTYVRNRPLSATDPTGHTDWEGLTRDQIYASQGYMLYYINMWLCCGISISPGEFKAQMQALQFQVLASEVGRAIAGGNAGDGVSHDMQIVRISVLQANENGSTSYGYQYVAGMIDTSGAVHMAELGTPIFGGGEIGGEDTNGAIGAFPDQSGAGANGNGVGIPVGARVNPSTPDSQYPGVRDYTYQVVDAAGNPVRDRSMVAREDIQPPPAQNSNGRYNQAIPGGLIMDQVGAKNVRGTGTLVFPTRTQNIWVMYQGQPIHLETVLQQNVSVTAVNGQITNLQVTVTCIQGCVAGQQGVPIH
jgi:RHS repeat-associated protein